MLQRNFGFIQKPVTVEQFEITKPNLVSRPRIQPDFEIFCVLEIQDGGWQPFWTIWDNHVGFPAFRAQLKGSKLLNYTNSTCEKIPFKKPTHLPYFFKPVIGSSSYFLALTSGSCFFWSGSWSAKNRGRLTCRRVNMRVLLPPQHCCWRSCLLWKLCHFVLGTIIRLSCFFFFTDKWWCLQETKTASVSGKALRYIVGYIQNLLDIDAKLECVPKFLLFGRHLWCRRRCGRARVRPAWAKFKELSPILMARGASYI